MLADMLTKKMVPNDVTKNLLQDGEYSLLPSQQEEAEEEHRKRRRLSELQERTDHYHEVWVIHLYQMPQE